jgi:hypothetical protein
MITLPEKPWPDTDESIQHCKNFSEKVAKILGKKIKKKNFIHNGNKNILYYINEDLTFFSFNTFFSLDEYAFSGERKKSRTTWTPFQICVKKSGYMPYCFPKDELPFLSKAIGVPVLGRTDLLSASYAKKFLLKKEIISNLKEIDFSLIYRMDLNPTQLFLNSKISSPEIIANQINTLKNLLMRLYDLTYPTSESAEKYRQECISIVSHKKTT